MAPGAPEEVGKTMSYESLFFKYVVDKKKPLYSPCTKISLEILFVSMSLHSDKAYRERKRERENKTF